MLKVAITDGIGSGKSFVCRKFNELGIPIFYTDDEAKLSYEIPEVEVKVKILFGDDIYLSPGVIDKKKLSAIIFNDKPRLELLYEIILPIIRNKFNNWAEEQTSPYVICESAILFESKGEDNFDVIITITCPINIRINRALLRGGINEEDLRARINSQIPESEKVKKSDITICNDGIENVDEEVLWIHNSLEKIIKKLR